MSATMLAAVYHGPDDLRLERRPVPAIGEDELLLRVASTSICATDLRVAAGGHRLYGAGAVRIPGHEMTGVVAAAGRGVRGLPEGQRVFVAPNMGCGECRQCRAGRNNLCPRYDAFGITLDGSFAEYMRVTAPAIRQGNVMPLPEGADPDVFALAEPLACVLHGQDAVDVAAGDVVAVLGAGPIGLMHVLLARQRGARLVIATDVVPERLAKALELGADAAVDARNPDLEERVRDRTAGEGVDAVIVAAPAHAAMEQAPRLAAARGRINLFAGLPKQQPEIRLDANLVHYKELAVTGTTACSTRDCRRAVDLLCSGEVDLSGLIGARYSLDQVSAAFEHARGRSGLKAMLHPGGPASKEAT